MKHHHFSHLLLMLSGMVLASCVSEQDPFATTGNGTEKTGTIELQLNKATATRATQTVSAAEAANYLITIYKGTDIYSPTTKLGELNTRIDAGYGYSLTAESCSEAEAESANEGWGKRRYAGKSDAFAITAGQTTKVGVACSVQNGGVSAYFDKTITDNFSDYSITITEGSRNLVFNSTNCDKQNGEVIDNGQIAYFNIPAQGRTISYTVNAGSVTKQLTQEVSVAKISRLRVAYQSGSFTFDINVDETDIYTTDEVTIVPDPNLVDKVPTITTQNVYQDGLLVGTKLTATQPADDLSDWNAVVKNGNGDVIRTLAPAKGTLVSNETDENWPYLPKGNYAMEYTFENYQGKVVTKSTTFTITENPNFEVSLNALTSYSYYTGDGVAKNITKANECENNKIYAPTVTVTGISDNLIAKYGLTTTFNNVTKQKEKIAVYSDYTVNEMKAYDLSATVTYAGITKNAAKTVYITGIPYTATPPTQDNGWRKTNGTVLWDNTFARLGNWSSDDQIEKNFYVPANINVSAYFHAILDPRTAGTTYKFYIGGTEKYSYDASGGAANTKLHDKESTENGTLTPSQSTVACYNRYGGGAYSCTRVYSVRVNYGE